MISAYPYAKLIALKYAISATDLTNKTHCTSAKIWSDVMTVAIIIPIKALAS